MMEWLWIPHQEYDQRPGSKSHKLNNGTNIYIHFTKEIKYLGTLITPELNEEAEIPMHVYKAFAIFLQDKM